MFHLSKSQGLICNWPGTIPLSNKKPNQRKQESKKMWFLAKFSGSGESGIGFYDLEPKM